MTKPAVTVLIDTYNHERFIEHAITSVLEQGFPAAETEILVVDDGSTDRTPEIVRKFEPRVRLIRKANGGQASAFNAGIPEARGDIVAFLDGDDWWAPNKLARVVEAMAADPSLGIVGNGIIMAHPDGRQQSETLREGFRFQANSVEGARLFRLRRSFLGTSRMSIRTEILRRIGPVPEEIRVQADEYLFTLAAVLAPGQILHEALTYYRFHEANAFQFAKYDPARLRNKQKSLAALATSLSTRLKHLPMEPQASSVITEIVKAEADQLRLLLDGGTPMDTLRVEWLMYDIHNPLASQLHRILKRLSLIPALLLPPRAYYRARTRITQNRHYRGARESMLPSASRQHVENEWQSSQGTSRSAATGRP